ncbi:hypothetical protein ACFWNK_34030 [Streptomyces sp. NPDC058417]|uniref:hypothetical protein n=1 Tax=unclassified Streptomyces TaxID=2593676 RepID=UPI00364EE027
MLTAYVVRGFADAQGNRVSDALPFEGFISAKTMGAGPFAHMHKGDLVTFNYESRIHRYTKNGEQFFQLRLEIHNVSFLETRQITQARLVERATRAEAAQKQSLQAPTRPVAAAAPAVVHVSAVPDEQLPFVTA